MTSYARVLNRGAEIMGCLDTYGSGSSELPKQVGRKSRLLMKTVWWPVFAYQILWRSNLPVKTHSHTAI